MEMKALANGTFETYGYDGRDRKNFIGLSDG